MVICALLVFAGINLRSVILGVPPILPLIRHDLSLSYTATGLLTALPTLLMGGVGWISGLLIERIGARTAVTYGLIMLASGALLRAMLPAAIFLYLFTILLGLGIALAQTAAPVLVHRWFPAQIGLVTALYTDGLILGETLGAGATVPIMLWLLGKNDWQATFIVWGLPVLLLLIFWLWLAPSDSPASSSRAGAALASSYSPETTPSDLNKPTISVLQIGLVLGAGSLIYFGMNSWIATYNQALHRDALTPLALTILNSAQLPSSLSVTFFARQMTGKRWPFMLAGFTCLLSVAGWMFGPANLEYLWAALIGASSALVFTMGLALPALLAGPGRVARVTGATLSIGYTTAFVGPFIGGGLWDLFGLPALVFVPVMLASALLIVLSMMLPAAYS